MNTVKCNNPLCEKEYNVEFDNCPFCGTANPLEESERRFIIEKDKTNGQKNGSEDNHPFNKFVTGIIVMSIIFGGIKGFINSLTYFIISPLAGILALGLLVFGIVVLCFILAAKKWAIYAWGGYIVAVILVNGYLDNDYFPYIFVGILKLVFLFLVLQIKKNGVSAWSVIFNGYKSDTTTCSSKEELIVSQENNLTSNPKEKKAIKNNDNIQTKKNDNSIDIGNKSQCRNQCKLEEDVVSSNNNIDEERLYYQKKIDKRKTVAFWIVMGLLTTILVARIWYLVNEDNINYVTRIEQIDLKSMGSFECSLFSFEYPREFKRIPIQNAPHMVLKLESDNCIMSASYRDYDMSEDISIWDDEIFEYYKHLPIEGGELIDIKKEYIQTKGGIVRCLKIKSNIHQHIDEEDVQIKILSYLLIQNGCLINFVFESEGEYTKTSLTTSFDTLMNGLLLKTNTEDQFAEAFNNIGTNNKNF